MASAQVAGYNYRHWRHKKSYYLHCFECLDEYDDELRVMRHKFKMPLMCFLHIQVLNILLNFRSSVAFSAESEFQMEECN